MKIKTYVIGMTILLAILLAGCSQATKKQYEAIPVKPGSLKGKVAFISTRGDTMYSMCMVNADGTGLKRIADKVNLTQVKWSPDGKALLFDAKVGKKAKTVAIYIDRDGTTETVVKLDNQVCSRPLWHPSGKKIFYSRSKDGVHIEFVELELLKRTERVIKRFDNPIVASISPSGRKVAFSPILSDTRHDGNQDIFVMDINGNNSKNITSRWGKNWSDWNPAWSPDGKKIAFVSTQDGEPNIFVMDAAGRNRQRISNNSHESALPHWSPDGTKIVYTSVRSWYEGSKYFAKSELFVIDIKTKQVWQLTKAVKSQLSRGLTYDLSPDWTR